MVFMNSLAGNSKKASKLRQQKLNFRKSTPHFALHCEKLYCVVPTILPHLTVDVMSHIGWEGGTNHHL